MSETCTLLASSTARVTSVMATKHQWQSNMIIDHISGFNKNDKWPFPHSLGSGTSSARNKNLRPLLNTNISLIRGKYCFRKHCWLLDSRFLIIMCQFKKKSTVKNWMSLTPCSCHLWPPISSFSRREFFVFISPKKSFLTAKNTHYWKFSSPRLPPPLM